MWFQFMKKPVLLILITVLALPWLHSLANVRSLQLYADSLFTIGAGARLAAFGNYSQTFMLYGLVNPYLLNLLLTLGAGGEAVYVLRGIQLSLAFLGILGLLLALRRIAGDRQAGFSYLSMLLLAFLGSPMFLVESFELTPEISMFAAVSWLLFASVRYDGSLCKGAFLAVIMAITAGTRPSALIFWIPALISACCQYHGSILKRYWRWAFGVVPFLAFFASAVLPSAGLRITVISAGILIGLISISAFIMDFRRGHSRYWYKLLHIVAAALLMTIILFPSYIMHYRLLTSQVIEFHLSRETPLDSILGIASNGLLGAANIFLLFPGFPASLGISVVIARIAGRNGFERHMFRKTLPFIAGLLVFVLSAIRYDNFQPRYLIPAMPLVFLFASAGIGFVARQKRFSVLLAVPVALATVSLWETSIHRRSGSILNAMYEANNGLNQTVCLWEVFPSTPRYYSLEDAVQWPAKPFIGSMELVPPESCTGSDVIVSYGLPPSGYRVVNTWGATNSMAEVLRGSDSPGWAELWFTLAKPWVWRSWGVACLSVPSP
jgi:hypothetical protein